jgi:hypothetical protein
VLAVLVNIPVTAAELEGFLSALTSVTSFLRNIVCERLLNYSSMLTVVKEFIHGLAVA